MFSQSHLFAPSTVLSLFLYFLLFSRAYSSDVLIVCNEGCGCVTESGVTVSCNFVKPKETAIIRASEDDDVYEVMRVVSIGTIPVDEGKSADATCLDKAGSNPGGSAICVPAPRPPKPSSTSITQGSILTRELKTPSGLCSATLKLTSSGTEFVLGFTPDLPKGATVGGAFASFGSCRAAPLKK